MILTLYIYVAVSCGRENSAVDRNEKTLHKFPDTLRVGTLYSPTSYFIYREETMGYDYDLVSKLATDKDIKLRIEKC